MGIGWVIDWPMTILGYIDMGYSCYVVFTSVYKSNGWHTIANTVLKVEKVVAIYMKKKTINYIKK